MATIGQQLYTPESGWQRIDDSSACFIYTSIQSQVSNSNYYNGTDTAINNDSEITFAFVGSKLRVISYVSPTQSGFTLYIDNVNYGFYNTYRSAQSLTQILIFDVQNLQFSRHSVRLVAGTSHNMAILDAIDIDSDGYVIQDYNVGSKITNPEIGWIRYDNSCIGITYTGTWITTTDSGQYSGGSKYTSTISKATFSFLGNRLRIVGQYYEGHSNNVRITIDGIAENISVDHPNVLQCLIYEKTGLSYGTHTVEILNTVSGKGFVLDAIDINSTGTIYGTIGQSLTAPESGWQRIDDSDERINYVGTWTTGTGTDNWWNSNNHYAPSCNNGDRYIKIKFYGTKFRVICATGSSFVDNISIQIDSMPTEFFSMKSSSTIKNALCYEKIDLPLSMHTVTIYKETTFSNLIYWDAIDIDSSGYLITQLGQKSLVPDTGWQRYDGENGYISLYGTWNRTSNSSCYNGYNIYTTDVNAKVRFRFNGSKLRIIGLRDTSRGNVNIRIDEGNIETYNENGTSQFQTLVYEKTGLTSGNHTVEISFGTNSFDLDAIDIDETGYLLHLFLEKKDVLNELNIGDYITCEYTALTSNSIGVFKNLGSSPKSEIPVNSSATPNGNFNFICVDRKVGIGGILIADRVIQHSISWNTLNTGKQIEGIQQILSIIPAMTSNTSPSGIASTNNIYNSNYEPYMAFNGVSSTYWCTATGISSDVWLEYEFPTVKIIKTYAIQANPVAGEINSSPKDWTFEGSNDNINWTVLDTQTNQPTWSVSEERTYSISNSTAFKFYRIYITANQGGSFKGSIGELKMSTDNIVFIRSISGGVAYADANGNLSTTNQSKGNFPISNEWDRYITINNLNEKITANNINVWNHNSLESWIISTPATSIGANTTRAKVKNNSYSAIESSTVSNTIGFRPILIWREDGGSLI